MLVENLIHRFKLVKMRNPLNAGELLDFIQKDYINGELSILEYKKIYFELNKLGAKKPKSFIIKTSSFNIEKYGA